MDLAKKKKVIIDTSKKIKIDNTEEAVSWLETPDKANIPLNDSKINRSSVWQDARNFSVIIHVDKIINLPPVALQQYLNKSRILLANYIEEYLAKQSTLNTDTKYYEEWQSLFRIDSEIIYLYAAVMNRVLSETTIPRELRFRLVDMIEEDKSFVLDTSSSVDISIKFRTLGFIPQNQLQSVESILQSHNIEGNDIRKLATEKVIVVLLYKTLSPIEIDTWILKNIHYSKQLLGDYNQYRGVNSGVIARGENIKYLKAHESKKKVEVVGDVKDFEYGYVLETLDLTNWRFLCPFNASSEYKVKKHMLNQLLLYIQDSDQTSRINNYHRHQERIIMDNMFFSRTMKPNYEYIETLAHNVDMSNIKHNITIMLSKLIKIDDTKNFYQLLSYIQSLGIKDAIIAVLLDEFEVLEQYDEFKNVLNKSSFPTSEIMLSYIIEVQNFAHILQKAIIDNIKTTPRDIPLQQVVDTSVQKAMDEKIRQEGSVIDVINFKSRLLYIDQ